MFGGRDTDFDARPFRVVASAPWLVVGVGVGVMVVLLLVAVGSAPQADRPTGGPGRVAPQWPFAPGPQGSRGLTIDPETSSPAVPSAGTGGPNGATSGPDGLPETAPPAKRVPPPQSAAPPAHPAVTGRYQLVTSFDDSFIGEVVVANASGTARHWTVELRFPADVGALRTFWVESAPQATLRRSGGLYSFTSTATLPARSTVRLRFHFDRSGASEAPVECRVNGNACVVR